MIGLGELAPKGRMNSVSISNVFQREKKTEIVKNEIRTKQLELDAVSTIPRTLAFRVAKTPTAPAFYYPDGNGKMLSVSWADVETRVSNIAGGLRQIGLAEGETAAIFSNTSLEWVLSDLAINSAGAITCAVMPGNKAEQLEHILKDSAAKVVIVENDEQLTRVAALREKLPHIEKVVNVSGKARGHDGWVIGADELEERGKAWNAANPGELAKCAMAVKPEDVATLIYTSGTTGVPKGVELQHGAWAAQAEAGVKMGFISEKDKQYLWLPLAHSFGKFLLSVSIRLGIPTVIDGNPNNIAKGLEMTHPTFTSGVPRVYEKIYNGIMGKSKEKSPFQRMVFNWAMNVGREVSIKHEKGKCPDILLATKYALADALVFSKIRAKLGGKIKFLLSGGAPLSAEVARGLDAMGLRVIEGYGLTETSGASHVNRPDNTIFGTVGFALPGVVVKLSEEPGSKGEILIKGQNVMKGYRNLPEQTAKEFTADGFFRTGDIGQFDEMGHLRITDRIKNIFKLSTGEYVAPAPMEQGIKDAGEGLVSNVLVHGYNRKFCSAVITLDEKALKKAGLSGGEVPFNENPRIRAEVQKIVDQMNRKLNLRGPNAVCKFYIAPTDFAVGCELTETQKVVRKVVETKYGAEIDRLYADDKPRMHQAEVGKFVRGNYRVSFA